MCKTNKNGKMWKIIMNKMKNKKKVFEYRAGNFSLSLLICKTNSKPGWKIYERMRYHIIMISSEARVKSKLRKQKYRKTKSNPLMNGNLVNKQEVYEIICKQHRYSNNGTSDYTKKN